MGGEDNGVNGDRWTDQGSRFLRRAGWTKIADSNIDLPGKDGLDHGIDMIQRYEDGFSPNLPQGVFVEAKHYATTSFSPKKISDWVSTLDKKIRELKHSEEFYNKYPAFRETNASNGLLLLWFHDLEKYPAFRGKLIESMKAIEAPHGRGPVVANNRLFVLHNDRILMLCSLFQKLEKIKAELGVEADANTVVDLKYYYPSSAGNGFSVNEQSAINLEYMFSQFVLVKAHLVKGSRATTNDYVFYFGKVDIHSFELLRHALLSFNVISGENRLTIFRYQADDDEFRKIEPDVLALFRTSGVADPIIKRLNTNQDLPDFILED